MWKMSPSRKFLLTVLCVMAGALLVSIVAPEYVLHVVLGLFAVCIVCSWAVVTQSDAMKDGPSVLFATYIPTGKARRTRMLGAFFFSAAATLGACVGLFARVVGQF